VKSDDEALFREILRSEHVEWEKKIPKAALRRLAAECLIDVETRRCSTWSFGVYPATDERNLDKVRSTFREWSELQKHRHFHDRTIVVAEITAIGRQYGYAHQMFP